MNYLPEGKVIGAGIIRELFNYSDTKLNPQEVIIQFPSAKLNRFLNKKVLVLIHKIAFSSMYVGTTGTTDTDVATISTINYNRDLDTKGISWQGILARKEIVRVSHVSQDSSPHETAAGVFTVEQDFGARVERWEGANSGNIITYYDPPLILKKDVIYGYTKYTGVDNTAKDQEQVMIHYSLLEVSADIYNTFQDSF